MLVKSRKQECDIRVLQIVIPYRLIKKQKMKTYKNVIKILMVIVTIGLIGIADAKAQNQRMMELQDEFSKYQTQYRD